MKFIVLSESQRDALARANQLTPDRQLSPVPLPDGRWALNADALDDHEYWGRHLAELAGCEVMEWHKGGGKVLPLLAGDQVLLEADLAVFKAEEAAVVELDPAKDFYHITDDDEEARLELEGKYAAEKARLTAALAELTDEKTTLLTSTLTKG